MRNADEVIASFNTFVDAHHIAEQIDDAFVDGCSESAGEQFLAAVGVLLSTVVDLHSSGDLANEWPELDALVNVIGK